ncbi:amino acid adenylation domain-containing protein [Micromonospora sp. WMMD1120]|uniref:amino acid adenylation domain-containing protein n=1 Tax=Micromonospora sp. WMMD1120 TaxID=3016106 RepID=UPI002417F334|nr:amino acid adenylation domain-containing protein [Micromonospora sp. WMMD1120]MDG4810895.1 amino acid adenylation domain-containing protein [Micromonospora sp. WMMD1120]
MTVPTRTPPGEGTPDPVTREPSEALVAARVAQLTGAPTVLELPSDLTRPATRDHAGARLAFALSDPAASACARLAADRAVSRTTVLLAAWSLVLARRAGVRDLLLGHTLADGRVVPVRCALAEGTSVRAYLGGIASELAAAETAGVPVDELRARLDVPDDPRRAALLQFVVDARAEDGPERFSAGPVEVVDHDSHPTGDFPLDAALVLRRWGPRAELALEYATAALLPAEAGALADSLDATLVELLDSVNEPLDAVRTISRTQRARIAAVRNGPLSDSSDDVWRMVAAVALRHGDTEAVDGPELTRPLSYADLVSAVERLAARLAQAGVGPGVNVLIAHSRSARELVSVLAVLRCGGTYVAFDNEAPDDRLRRMFSAVDPRAIVGDPTLVDRVGRLCPSPCATVIAPDPLASDDVGRTVPPLPPVDPDRPAYITFTSGSTGTPKAVRIPHRAVVRLVRDPSHVRCGPGERMLRFAPLAFDASTLELFAPLANGGAVEVIPHELPSSSELATFIEERGVTVLWLTAGLFRLMVDLAPHAFAGVRQVLTGGDVVPPEQARRLLERFPGIRVTCGYGPTENTTFSTVHHLDDPDAVQSPLPIGRAIAGTGLLILDQAGGEVPPGGIGELYVTGAGLAIDYLGAPEQTRAAFGLPAPDTGERMYRTGDLVRLDAQGVLRFLGRTDHQVKVRGYRIETEEIVARLLEHPSVRDAVVVAVGDGASSRRLLAGVVADSEPRLEVTLRAHLARSLPRYAVPALWAFVERIPLTANGKVDAGELERVAERLLAERRRR